jgi:hypothetical protein
VEGGTAPRGACMPRLEGNVWRPGPSVGCQAAGPDQLQLATWGSGGKSKAFEDEVKDTGMTGRGGVLKKCSSALGSAKQRLVLGCY